MAFDGTQNLVIKYPWSELMIRAIQNNRQYHRKPQGDSQGRGGRFARNSIDSDLPKEVQEAANAYKDWNGSRVKLAKQWRRYKDILDKEGTAAGDNPKVIKLYAEIQKTHSDVYEYKTRLDNAKQIAMDNGYKIDSRGKWKNKGEVKKKVPDLPPEEPTKAKWAKKGFNRVIDRLATEELIDAEEMWDGLNTNGKMDLPDFLNSTYNYTDKATGINLRINSVTAYKQGEGIGLSELAKTPTIEVSGMVFNADGNVIGSFRRRIDKNGVAHKHFELTSDQNSGFGSRYYSHTEKKYVEAGISGDIRILANIDVGGYAWARMGYDFEFPAEAASFKKKFIQDYDRMYGTDAHKNLDTIPESSFEIASFKGPRTIPMGSADKTQVEFGKYFLLNSMWNAKKPIDPNSTEWKVGENYYKAKGI